uniref:SsDNA binding protein n=1 Tax=Staphylococcus phage UHP46 TaxID=3234966 RepID=A0AB39C8H2_9CAUD
MSAFQDFLKQEKKQLESAGFNNNDGGERYTPKNPVLRLGKVKDANGQKVDKKEAYVRILPPVEQGSMAFAKGFRTTGINYSKKDGSQGFSGLTLPLEEGSSVIDPFIAGWIRDGVAFSLYPNKPATRYFIHVVEYVPTANGIQPRQDAQGNLLIQPMEITKTAYDSLIGKLEDQFLSPSPNADYRFISENEAFLVKFTKAEKGQTSWGLDVYSNQNLGALPSNWRELTSDLEALAKPTEEQNPNFVNFLINNVNNTELSVDNFKFNRESNVLGAEPTQEPTQDSIESQLPDNLAPQQGYNQSQQGQVGEYAQPGVNQTPPQQQSQPLPGTQQPIDNTQQGQGNPFEGFDPSQMSAPQQPVQQQQPAQPQQPVQPQQPQSTEPAQPQPNRSNGMGAIDDVLEGLDLDNL